MSKKKMNEEMARIGIDQFVRNVAIPILKKYAGKPEKIDELMHEVNRELLKKFKTLASKSFGSLLKQAYELTQKGEPAHES